jgi:hypothetical protein
MEEYQRECTDQDMVWASITEHSSWFGEWARDENREFVFLARHPYRRTAHGESYHEQNIRWDHIVPIHLNVDGKFFAFVMDVRRSYQHEKADFSKVKLMADAYVSVLNSKVSDPEWRAKVLPYLLLDDVHCGGLNDD